jgi:hypothetical protein
MKRFLPVLLALGALYAGPEDKEIWVVEQEFAKFGRKEAFEEAKKKWIADFEKFTAHRAPYMIGLEDAADNEYLFLIPFNNFAEIDSYRKQLRDYKASLSAPNRMVENQMLNSLINYKILTIHQYKAECSYCPSSRNMLKTPKVSYTVVTLLPGGEDPFEQMLIQKTAQAVKKNSKECWRVWKTLIGAELPKYIVARFLMAEEEVQIELIDPSMNEIIRRRQDGQAAVRPELCISGS